MKNKKMFYLILALMCAVIAAVSVYHYLAELEEEVKGATEYDSVIVAREDISPRTRVSPAMLEEKEFPSGYVHPQAAREIEDISNGITTAAIHSGEQVLANKIAEDGKAEDGFAYKISEGKRALAVEVNEVVAVGGLLLPGDRVDVIATLEVQSEAEEHGGSTSISKIITENIRVLSVGQEYDSGSEQNTHETAETVTLEVVPEDASPLTLAEERGSIRLMLRSPVDEQSVPTEAWEMQDFAGGR